MNHHIFTYVIMALYALNVCWNIATKDYARAFYWAAAFQITLSTTMFK